MHFLRLPIGSFLLNILDEDEAIIFWSPIIDDGNGNFQIDENYDVRRTHRIPDAFKAIALRYLKLMKFS